MKKDRIKYFVRFRTKENEIIQREKEGYLIRIEAIEPGEYLYFVVAKDIDKEGNQLLTWGIDEYYTGLKLLGGYPQRNLAINSLIRFWQDRKHELLIRKVKAAIDIIKSRSCLSNNNPEDHKGSVNDLSYMAYGRTVSKHGK